MLVAWLKMAHVSGLVVWCGGLLVLPALFGQKRHYATGHEAWRLQRLARAAYTRVVSPAAFVAIATGTALVLVESVFSVWFALKLGAVGVLVALHARIGYLVVEVFRPEARFPPWRAVAGQGAVALTALAILVLVLAKPDVDLSVLPAWVHLPGGLYSTSETLIPMP